MDFILVAQYFDIENCNYIPENTNNFYEHFLFCVFTISMILHYKYVKRLCIVYRDNIQFTFNLHKLYVVAPCSSQDNVNMQIMKEKGYLDTKLQKFIVCFQEQMDRS